MRKAFSDQLDEVEKAHRDVFNVLFLIMEEGLVDRAMSQATRWREALPLEVHGGIVEGHVRLRWRPIERATNYTVLWLDDQRKWRVYELLEDEGIIPKSDGLLEWVDDYPGPLGPGGTYRVEAFADPLGDYKVAESAPVVVRAAKRTQTTIEDLRQRLVSRKIPARVRSLIMALRFSRRGWSIVLPEEAGTCLGKPIEVSVQARELTDSLLDLLERILENLPKLAARAERAFDDHTGGIRTLDEGVRLARPQIWIDPEHHRAGDWTMVIEVKDSDYAWHVEFTRTRFREIWSGD